MFNRKRRIIGNNFIDANVLHRTDQTEDAAVERILELHDAGDFTLLLPYSVTAELEHPNTPAYVKHKARQFVVTLPVELTKPELANHDKIRALLRGNSKGGQHDKDAFHLAESAKNGGLRFITKDKRLLDKSPEILAMLSIQVFKPSEFLAVLCKSSA